MRAFLPSGVRVTSLASFLWLALAALLVFGSAPGCGKSGSKPAQSYVVRGQITVMPGERQEIEIHHEAIADFVNYSGDKVGMMAMIMPFGVDRGLDLSGVAVGDKVEFTIAMDWDRKPAGYLTAIRKLPPDTELAL